jgi:ATP-dependent protease ClpP protease subunit
LPQFAAILCNVFFTAVILHQMTEILLYNYLYDYTAATFISQLEANKDKDVVIRMNTNGGSPESTFGMIAKMSERTKSTKIKVDGKANSMGAFMLAYASDVEALDVSEIMIHRASYGTWIEKDSNIMTAEMWATLDKVNGKLRTALESKINTDSFYAITGKTMNDVFSNDTRIDVVLTAEQAKMVGLIDRVVNITPTMNAEIRNRYAMAAQSGIQTMPITLPEIKTAVTANKTNNMTINELKSAHPELVAQIEKSATLAERDRVGSFMVYAHLDLEACKKGITEGATLSAVQMADFALKAVSAQFVANAEAGSAGTVTTTKVETPEVNAAKAEGDFWKEATSGINI